jgi:hypothetical protein
VQTAIKAIWRDLDYAKSLIRTRAALQDANSNALADEDIDIEESWTFIGNEKDPDLQRTMQEMDLGARRPPRVSVDGLRSMQGVEPVRRAQTTKT